MRIDSVDFIRALAAALEDGMTGDGTHLGPTDSELCARALRLMAATADTPACHGEKPEAA